MAKKKTTQEILAAARAEVAKQQGQEPNQESAEEENSAQDGSAAEAAAAEQQEDSGQASEKSPSQPKAGTSKPKSTKDILATARAEAAKKKESPQSSDSGDAEEESKPASAASKAASSKPKSTKDILAAARAETAGGGSKQAEKSSESQKESKPAAAKGTATKAKPATSKPSGERPSVQEMLKAVREGKKAEETPAAGKPRVPKVPKKPVPSRKPAKSEKVSRRSVLVAMLTAPLGLFSSFFSSAWTLFAAACGVFTLALARFMMPNVLVEPPTKFKIGPPSDYPLGVVSTKWKASRGIWVVHSTEYEGRDLVYALISVCTHLGCTPNWLQGEQKFKCPCHGSGFYITGVNFEGPAPRPLERAGIRLAADGMLEVDKSQTFQEELGQWEDPASYVEMV